MSKKKQTVNGDVGNVVSGDVTIHNYSTEEPSVITRQPISKYQRQDLHRLMDKLALLGENKQCLWRDLHTKLDTKTINEMTTADYHRAVEILEQNVQQIEYIKDCNTLISKIMSLTNLKYRSDRNNYCLRHFGTAHLKRLNKEQLQKVFAHFDEVSSSSNVNVNKLFTSLCVTKFKNKRLLASVAIFFFLITLYLSIG